MSEDLRPHMNNVVKELNDSSFAATFGDIKLVFANGEVTHHLSLHPPDPPSTQVIPYFKSLLSLLSLDWKLLLQLRPDSKVTIIPLLTFPWSNPYLFCNLYLIFAQYPFRLIFVFLGCLAARFYC